MKVLFLNHTGVVSGAERVLLTILEALDRSTYEPTVSCPMDTDLAELVRDLKVPTVSFPSLEARFTWNPIRLGQYLISYASAIRKFRKSGALRHADIIHANSVRAGLLASFATIGTGIPVVWHLHDIMKAHPISTIIRGVAVMMPTVSVLAVSRATADSFRGRLIPIVRSPILVSVLYNSIDCERFRTTAEERQRVRRSLEVKDGQFVFALVGQLTPRKGQLETIHAFSAVCTKVPNASLLIIGAPLFNDDHRYAASLQAAVNTLGIEDKVCFLGQRSDIPALLSAADAVVINSKREPFGLIVLEALAAGKPVVATRVDGIPELITDEVTGLLVPSGDNDALGKALLRLAQTPELCTTFSIRGRELAKTGFTHASYIRSLEAFYSRTRRPSRRDKIAQPSHDGMLETR